MRRAYWVLLETVAQSEGLDDVVAHAPLVEIAEAHGTPHLVVEEQVGKVLLGKLADMEQGVALVLAFLLLLGQLLLLHLDVVFIGQPSQCLGIGVVFMLHQESHHIA